MAIEVQGDRPRPHGGRTGPRGPATPPRRPYQAQGIGHTPTAALWAQGTGHAPTAAVRGPGDRPRSNGGHTGSWGPATRYGSYTGPRARPRPHSGRRNVRGPAAPPRRPYGAQGTGRAPTSAARDPGDRPRPNGGRTRPSGPAAPPRRAHGAHGCFMFIKRQTFDDVTEALETRYEYLATRAGDYFLYGLHACHSCGFSYN